MRPFREHTVQFTRMEARAEAWLERLRYPSQSLMFWLGFEELALEWDLFVEQSVEVPECLALQVRVFELAETYPAAESICRSNRNWLSARILQAILASGVKNRATQLKIESNQTESVTNISEFQDGDWVWVGRLPNEQARDLFCELRLLEAVGYEQYRPYLSDSGALPEEVSLRWDSLNSLSLSI